MKSQPLPIYFMILCLTLSLTATSCAKRSQDKLTSELLPVVDSPLVSFRILLKVGSANDPLGKEGIGALTLSLLASGGSKALTYKEITEKFYPMAAGVGMRIDKEMSVLTGTIHKDNLEPYYAVFKDMLLDPGFREEDFIRLKTNQLNFLEKTLAQPVELPDHDPQIIAALGAALIARGS